MYLEDLEICYHTTVDIGIPLPLELHISKIMPATYYMPQQYNQIKYDVVSNSLDKAYQYNSFSFHSKFKEHLQVTQILEIIYDFIDHKSISKTKCLKNIVPNSKDSFVEFILNNENIHPNTIKEIYSEILWYIEYIKNEFISKAIKILEIDKEYPEIHLKQDLSDDKLFKDNQEYLKPNVNKITLSTYIEYAGHIIFDENINRACNQYSWRETEIRRLYLKKKADEENFIEKLRSKILENSMEESKIQK